MRGRAALSYQSGSRTLAPFDGITRIRFKGSVAGATLSAIAAPPHYHFSVRIGLAQAKSINCNGQPKADTSCQPVEDNAFHLVAMLAGIYPAGDVDGGGATFESV